MYPNNNHFNSDSHLSLSRSTSSRFRTSDRHVRAPTDVVEFEFDIHVQETQQNTQNRVIDLESQKFMPNSQSTSNPQKLSRNKACYQNILQQSLQGSQYSVTRNGDLPVLQKKQSQNYPNHSPNERISDAPRLAYDFDDSRPHNHLRHLIEASTNSSFFVALGDTIAYFPQKNKDGLSTKNLKMEAYSQNNQKNIVDLRSFDKGSYLLYGCSDGRAFILDQDRMTKGNEQKRYLLRDFNFVDGNDSNKLLKGPVLNINPMKKDHKNMFACSCSN